MSYRITDVSFDPSKIDEFYAYADTLRDQLKAVNGLQFVHVIDVDEGQSVIIARYDSEESAVAATETIDDVDANVFLGQSNFHAAGVALATNKPTYILDPYFNEIREITDFARKLQKKATLEIYKAADAETFGVIVGLKEGQLSKLTALKFKKELESEGKTVHLIALTDITNERLRNLKNIDAFIQVACPRISTDNKFDKPVLSTPQAIALMKVLRKENIESYFQIKHWL